MCVSTLMYCVCVCVLCVCVCARVVYNRTLVIGTKQGSLVGGEVGEGRSSFSQLCSVLLRLNPQSHACTADWRGGIITKMVGYVWEGCNHCCVGVVIDMVKL